MGITLTIQASLVLIIITGFFIMFVLNKYNKKLSGITTILLGIAIATLGTTLPDLANMSAISATIIIFIGTLVFFDGWINKR